jgi:peptidoglycan hydrolase-like protein with peptidoglycan-binding domain
MKRLHLLLLGGLFCAASAFAEDHVRDVQAELKNQGFYYGEVDGKAGDQLAAAVRRYQIRNGLDVSGQVDPALLQSLGIGGAPAAPPAAERRVPPPAPVTNQVAPDRAVPAARPPVNLRRGESVEESDRRALQEEARRTDTLPHPNTAPAGVPNRPSAVYRGIFSGTPYQSAPESVQVETFRHAQHVLAARGFLREAPDDRPGPQTEEALLSYQRSSGLPLTGRLDLQTLNVMHLLPGRNDGNPGLGSPGPGRVARPLPYKNIWVQ